MKTNKTNYDNIRLMFDSMPYACHLWNEELEILDCNGASMELFKVKSKGEFIARFFEFSPEFQPDGSLSSEKAALMIKTAFATGGCFFNWWHIDSEGKRFPTRITLVRVESGGEKLLAAYIIDLSEYHAMLMEIERNEHLLDTANRIAGILLQSSTGDFTNSMYQCMGMMAGAVDADRVYIWKNYIENGELYCTQIHEWSEKAAPQQDTEYTVGISYRENIPGWEDTLARGECINNMVKDMPPASQAQLSAQGIRSIFVAPVFLRGEFWGFIGFDDCHSERVFSDNEASVLRSAGLLIANSMLKRDMNLKLKEALEETQAANLAKTNFLSNMSHEIRTPMNVIIGMSDILLRESLNNRQMGCVSDINMSAHSLLGIINDILDMSKIEAGKFELRPVDYSFCQLLDNIVSMFTHVAGNKGIEFRYETKGEIPEYLHGDDIRLRQILTNILGNAVKFTEKGYVRLKITASEGALSFEIKDSGIGIRKEDIPKLFNSFQRVDKARNRHIVGTGLGLAISKVFAEMMGGEITVRSIYGRGTVFTVNIPYVRGCGENSAKEVKEKAVFTFRAPGAKILVTDDNEVNLKVAIGLLGMMGIAAETADSGFKAINAVKRNDYDIVFMDHMMPEMDGVETVLAIRELGGKYKNLTIIALTANAVGNAREMFLENGFTDFISKPINIDELCEMVKKYLSPEKILTCAGKDNQSAQTDAEEKLRLQCIITFVKENQKTIESITHALNSGDITTAHRIAHTLKSTAAYVGKNELREAAFDLEKTLSGSPAAHTPEQLNIIEKELILALREFDPIFRASLNEKPETAQFGEKEIAALLTELKPLLLKGDFSALHIAEKLRGVAGMEELAGHIEDYDFAGALKVLEDRV